MELRLFSPWLANKPSVVVLNKHDLPEVRNWHVHVLTTFASQRSHPDAASHLPPRPCTRAHIHSGVDPAIWLHLEPCRVRATHTCVRACARYARQHRGC